MAKDSKIFIRSVLEQDRPQLANLVHFEAYVHRHLDWRPPLDWIGFSPYLIAERGRHLLAALACPPDPVEVAWIRLFAVSSEWSAGEAWKALWPAALTELSKNSGVSPGNGVTLAAIPLQQWFRALLERSEFVHLHDIVLLLWQRGTDIPKPHKKDLIIRSMSLDDMPKVEEIDREAFGLLWRNSLDSLELAFRQSAVATIAENDHGALGYQISTASPMGGHLARLAVTPKAQGEGIGYALVYDMLDQFERRGAVHVSVNTQHDNSASLALYDKAGFRRTGETYPVYQYMPGKAKNPAT